MSASTSLQSRAKSARATRLILRSRELASGWAAGGHRADRKGAGVEFAGHRAYTPGDDLRHLDRHALLKHHKLLIRQFLTDTERSLHLVVDATTSMHYRARSEKDAPPEDSKVERAILLGSALAHLARAEGDHLGVSWIDDTRHVTYKPRGGSEALDRALHEFGALLDRTSEGTPGQGAGAGSRAPAGTRGAPNFEALFREMGSTVPRGSIIILLSDLLDLKESGIRSLSALCTQRRTVRAARILTRDETEFPFEGALRLRDPETGGEVETDGGQVRASYLEALRENSLAISSSLVARGGLFIVARTDAAPEDALRALATGNPGPHS